MRLSGHPLLIPLVAAAFALAASGSRAQSPTQPTAPQGPPPAVAEQKAEEPSLQERRIVAYVASGVAVASLAAGITMGVIAQQQFDCASDIIACNQGLQNKVVGEEIHTLRAEIEQKALFADMFYLFSAAAAVVATVGFLRGFVFVDEEEADATAPIAAAALPPETVLAAAPQTPAPTLAVANTDDAGVNR
jgi:hypothetical protein